MKIEQNWFIWVYMGLLSLLFFLISLYYRINFLTSLLLFYLIPSLILSYYHRKYIVLSLLISLLMLPVFTLIDYIGTVNLAWQNINSIFDIRIYNFFTIEEILWAVALNYFIAIIYLSFLNNKIQLINVKTKFLIFIDLIIILSLSYIIENNLFIGIRFFYLLFGLLFISIPVILSMKYKFFDKNIYMVTSIFFICYNFINEILGLRLGWWSFPRGNLIFNMYIPIEELIFFILLGVPAILSYIHIFLSKYDKN